MIKKHNASFGLNTNVHVDPAASANASPNITNHIYIRDFKRKVDEENSKPQTMNFNASAVSENNVMNRDIKLDDEENNDDFEQEQQQQPKQKEQHILEVRILNAK